MSLNGTPPWSGLFDFAQIFHLKLEGFWAAEVAGALKRDAD